MFIFIIVSLSLSLSLSIINYFPKADILLFIEYSMRRSEKRSVVVCARVETYEERE